MVVIWLFAFGMSFKQDCSMPELGILLVVSASPDSIFHISLGNCSSWGTSVSISIPIMPNRN